MHRSPMSSFHYKSLGRKDCGGGSIVSLHFDTLEVVHTNKVCLTQCLTPGLNY